MVVGCRAGRRGDAIDTVVVVGEGESFCPTGAESAGVDSEAFDRFDSKNR